MKELNLHRTWEILNRIAEAQDELAEKSIYVHLLGARSNYGKMTYDSFLSYYSFKFDEDTLVVFNDDFVPYEDYTVGDFSHLPIEFFEEDDSYIDEWIEEETAAQLKQQEEEKSREKENIKQQIEQLQKRLKNL